MERVYDNQREAVLVGYLAGIFDGEGTVGLTKVDTSQQKRTRYTARLTMGMCVQEIVGMFQQRYGGAIRVERVPNRKPVYRWALVGSIGTKRALEELTPILVEKRERAELLLEYIGAIDITRYRNKLGHTLPITDEELSKREDFYQRMKELNAWKAPATTNREDIREGEVIV